jgi:hypothetical protein
LVTARRRGEHLLIEKRPERAYFCKAMKFHAGQAGDFRVVGQAIDAGLWLPKAS